MTKIRRPHQQLRIFVLSSVLKGQDLVIWPKRGDIDLSLGPAALSTFDYSINDVFASKQVKIPLLLLYISKLGTQGWRINHSLFSKTHTLSEQNFM